VWLVNLWNAINESLYEEVRNPNPGGFAADADLVNLHLSLEMPGIATLWV